MRKSLLVERYTQALGDSIPDPAELRAALEALSSFCRFYERTAPLRHALENPAHDVQARASLLQQALQAHQAPPVVQRFLQALLDRNRMGLLPEIADDFEHRIDQWLNSVEVTVVTVVPLPEDLRGRLVQALGPLAGKTVRLRSVVDPSIVGGLIVYMWGVYFDFSLRTRLERLKQELLEQGKTQYGY